MRVILRVFSAFVISALAMLAAVSSMAGQGATGTVNVQVLYCPQLEMAAELPGVPEYWCAPGPGQFSFYLVGDGTADFEILDVPLAGTASITLPVGEYEVWEENTFVKMSVFVEPNKTTSIIFGIPSESGPETPSGDVYVSTWACPGVSVVSYADVVPADCVRIATTLTFYLMGDGTDAHYSVPTMTTGALLTSLPLGMYKVIDEPTQAHVYVTVGEQPSEAHIVYPKAADPVTPTPAAPVATKVPTTTTPVTKLPSTGSGSSANTVAFGAIAVGAMLTLGAIGLQVRKA